MEAKRYRDTHYLVHRDGRVFSEKSGVYLRWKDNRIGYQGVDLSVGEKGKKDKKRFYVHRLVAECFIDNPDGCKTVNHKDGDKMNNCVENLEWVSFIDNYRHGVEIGKCNGRKEEVIFRVKELIALGCSNKDVAEICCVSVDTVKGVRSGKRYKWLK